MRTKLITLIVLFAVVLTSCAPAATPVPTAEPAKPAAVEPTSAPAVVEPTQAPAPKGDPQTSVDDWAANIKTKLDGTEINVAFGTHPSTDAFQKMAADFTTKTGIKVNWDVMEGAALKDKQLLEFTGHTGRYDVLMMDGFWISEYVPKAVVMPIDELIKDKDMTPCMVRL